MVQYSVSYINDNFGSRRGFYQYSLAKLLGVLGYWNKYREIPFERTNRLIFICNGNICRSPLGEYVAKASGFTAQSYGLRCTRGAKPDPRAESIAANNGIDISAHHTRPLDDYVHSEGDLIIVMEPSHIENPIIRNKHRIPLTLLGLWGDTPNAYIHDPFNTNEKYFEKCEKEIIARTKRLLLKIQTGP